VSTIKFRYNNIFLFLIIISLVASLVIYPSLPETIPSHWNIRGEIDVEARKKLYLRQNKAYNSITIALVLFFLFLHWIIIFSALGYSVSTSRFLPVGIGLLFLIIGYFICHIEPNHVFGIKTPWTLANEKVWEKTHQVGRFAFIFSGLIFILAGLINKPYMFTAAIITIFLIIFFLFFYSYLEYRKLRKRSGKQDS